MADVQVDAEKMTEEQQAWVTRMQQGPLHEDLVEYLFEEEMLGTVLRHPLVYQIPYFLPGQANEAYAYKKTALKKATALRQWHTVIFLHERPWRLDALNAIEEFEIPNKRWWQLVGDVWTDSENIHQNAEPWEAVWADARPNRQACMDKDEKAALRALPAMLTVYRGALVGLNEEGMSWTLDRARAAWFAKRFQREGGEAAVIEATVPKSAVLAHFLGRNEAEIVVSTHCDDLKVVALHDVEA